jgi:hypothetical protein
MSPLTVFFRTLLKSSAIFIGTAMIFLHPSLEWRDANGDRTAVGAQQSAREGAIAGLIALLKDTDPGVRAQAADTLGEIGDHKALDALTGALKDEDASVRRHAAAAIAKLSGGTGPHPHPHPLPHPMPSHVKVQ